MLTLLPRLERAKRCFALILANYDIDVSIEKVPGTLQVGKMLEAELYAVLLNALSNAIKSVIAAGAKRIEVTAQRQEGQKTISVKDSGIGLDESLFEEVFAPFVADPGGHLYKELNAKLNPEDQYIVGTGSGLGLSIVREIVASRGGSVRFVTPPAGWKANLEVTLP